MIFVTGITVGLQETVYTIQETHTGPVNICAEMFVGNLEREVVLRLSSTDGSAIGD